MELAHSYSQTNYDSVVILTTHSRARLNISIQHGTRIAVISSDSLTAPLNLNRDGDKIVISTYYKVGTTKIMGGDSICYGDYPGASVGKPISGYSIMRIHCEYSMNFIEIDWLTKAPSLGIANDTLHCSGTLKGHMYDSDNKPVKRTRVLPMSPTYFVLQTPITIDTNGLYSTKIFPSICSPTKLIVRMVDFSGWMDTVPIEPFTLHDIHPDTVVLQDIHLKNNNYVAASVKGESLPAHDELAFINYPNPFNSSTNFFVRIPDKLNHPAGEITILNMAGQLIKSIFLKDGQIATWDGKDSDGNGMPSGTYFYKLTVNKRVLKTGSMILLK